jgi:type I restriction enzyme S subunit
MSDEATLDEFVEAESDSSEPEAEDLARKTVCGIPPQDWTVARLGELVRVVSGNSLPTEYQNGKEGDHPVYKVSDMNATGNQKYVSDTANRLSKGDLEEINHTLYPEGTTILPKVGAALLTNKRRMLTEPSSFDNNVMGWVPDEINPEFLYYVSCMIDMEAVAQKGAVPSISKAIAKSLKLPSPPLPEQRKIATVLYTVDQAIEKTEDIIEETKIVQRGVENHLFQEGFFDHSNFKEIQLVKLPQGWQYDQLSEHTKSSAFGPRFGSERYDEDGDIATLRTTDLNEKGHISPENMPVANLERDEIEEHLLQAGDFIITRSGTTGIGAVWEGYSMPTIPGAFLIRFRFKNTLDPNFVKYYVNSSIGRKRINRRAKGGVQKNLAGSDLLNMRFPIPSKEEQREIVRVLDTIEERIQDERKYKNNLQRLKRGLMQDLLSGEVRTTDATIEVPEEIAQYG